MTRPMLSAADAAATPEDAVATEALRKPLRFMLSLYTELSALERPAQDAALISRLENDEQRSLVTYALSLTAAVASPLYELLDTIEIRQARNLAGVEISPADFESLHATFNAMPAQLHPALLGHLDAARYAVALALGLMPTATATVLWPALGPIILCPDPVEAKQLAVALIEQPEKVAPLLEAYRALPLSTRAAVSSELPAALKAVCIIVQYSELVQSESIAQLWHTLDAVSSGLCPEEGALIELHRLIAELNTMERSQLVRSMDRAGSLLEAAAHMAAPRWVLLALSMRTVNGRLQIESRRISMALLRSEAGSLRRSYTANPEQRSLFGFLCGWLVLLVAFFALLHDALATYTQSSHMSRLVLIMLDLYILLCALVTCALELEINSTFIRDHVALPLERSLTFLKLASGRGVFYCATG